VFAEPARASGYFSFHHHALSTASTPSFAGMRSLSTPQKIMFLYLPISVIAPEVTAILSMARRLKLAIIMLHRFGLLSWAGAKQAWFIGEQWSRPSC